MRHPVVSDLLGLVQQKTGYTPDQIHRLTLSFTGEGDLLDIETGPPVKLDGLLVAQLVHLRVDWRVGSVTTHRRHAE